MKKGKLKKGARNLHHVEREPKLGNIIEHLSIYMWSSKSTPASWIYGGWGVAVQGDMTVDKIDEGGNNGHI